MIVHSKSYPGHLGVSDAQADELLDTRLSRSAMFIQVPARDLAEMKVTTHSPRSDIPRCDSHQLHMQRQGGIEVSGIDSCLSVTRFIQFWSFAKAE